MGNILQMLGLQSPGLVSDDSYGGSGGSSDPLGGMPSYGAAIPQQPDVNAFQGMNAPPPAAMPAPAPAAPEAPQGTRPARARSSILDAIGRVSDVLAQVGGATPLYQPTLDSRQDRVLALGDHDRKVDLDKLNLDLSHQKIDSGAMDNATQSSKMIGQAVRGLKAIMTANPNADVSTIWPMLARQAGVPDDRAAVIGQAITAHPDLINGLIDAATDPKDDHTKFGFQPIYTKDASGVLHVRQLSSDGTSQIPDGETPIDPFKAINTGGSTVLVGSRTGTPQRILPNSEKPGGAADRQTRRDIAAHRDQTALTIAGMPARPKAGDQKAGGDASNVSALLDNIAGGFRDLHGMNALPGDNGGAVGNVLGALGRTRVGQAVGEQAGSAAAQKRLEIAKNVSALQQAMLKSLPASATRTKFEQEMLARGLPDATKMSLGTANTVIRQLRESFARAQQELAAKGGTARPTLRAPVLPRGGAGAKPTVSNW